MSSAASDDEVAELVAALSDDAELLRPETDDPEDDPEDPEELEDEELDDEPPSPREETDDDDDELHIAARAGIRLLEENMHFREEVLRLHEQLTHVKDEKAVLMQSLSEEKAQNAALSTHLRTAILENQSVLSELSQAKDQLRATQEQLTQLQQQRSPRRRTSNQRLSPRRSMTFSRPLVFDEGDGNGITPPTSPTSAAPAGIQSPTTTTPSDSQPFSPPKPSETVDRRLSYGDTSPRRRPSGLARLREVEAKYDEEHQRCSSLKLELNFAQRRVSELKPLQGQLDQLTHELDAARSRVADVEAILAQSLADHNEKQELIQSLRQTIHAYEQLNDPRQRGVSTDFITAIGEDETEAEQGDSRNEHFARLDRAAEMIDGRFDLRDANERLLQQLNALASRVLELPTIDDTTTSKQRYLQQQVGVLQELLRRFRLEWQHAHDARVCLEDEKAELLKQIERQRATLQRTRSASVSSSRRASVESPHAVVTPTMTLETPEKDETPEDDDDDDEAAHAQRLWEHTNAICEALLRPSASASKDEDADHELLCFALLRRLVDSWTTDKPKRMQLHDWLTNAIRGTGVRKPLYLHELSSEIAMGFQTLMVPILQDKFGVVVHVERRLRNVIVTDLRIHVEPPREEQETVPSAQSAARVQRVYHSLLSVIDGENGVQGSDEYHEWLGNYSARRASRGFLSK